MTRLVFTTDLLAFGQDLPSGLRRPEETLPNGGLDRRSGSAGHTPICKFHPNVQNKACSRANRSGIVSFASVWVVSPDYLMDVHGGQGITIYKQTEELPTNLTDSF